MLQMDQFSIYNNQVIRPNHDDNILRDLWPDNCDHGWSVARNLIKPLNHIELLKQKEQLAIELNLHNQLTPPDIFDENYKLLARHQAKDISTKAVIQLLASQHNQAGLHLSESKIAQILREYAKIPHMEFHPSDICNLTCYGCTYGHDDPKRKPPAVTYPLQEIHKIAEMGPKSMVIIGGGEPTLYKHGVHRFQNVIDELCHTNNRVLLALVTNGTYKPPGDWPNRFSWIRLSLDAASEQTYQAFRGKPIFKRVIRNYLDYLDYNIRYVGVSFLFSQSNVHDYAKVAKFIYDLVKRERPHALHKVNIQYRPLRRDPYLYNQSFTQAVTREQVEQAIREVRDLADSSTEMKVFLKNQTNITAIMGGNTHPPHEFSRCYYSQMFRIVRANGDLRPCFIRISESDFILGNIQSDSLETIALNTLFVGAKRKPYCDQYGCRQCHINYTFEQGLTGVLSPSTSPEVQADPMF